MPKFMAAIICLCFYTLSFAGPKAARADTPSQDTINRISSRPSANSQTIGELNARILELESAVQQLQDRVFGDDSQKPLKQLREWACTVKAFGESFSGVAAQKKNAELNAQSNCWKRYHGIHCRDVICNSNNTSPTN